MYGNDDPLVCKKIQETHTNINAREFFSEQKGLKKEGDYLRMRPM